MARLLDVATEVFETESAVVERLDLCDLSIEPCRGCMVCRKSGRCSAISDDVVRVVESLRHADGVVIGAPCYWANMPGQLKNMFDRMVYALITDGKGILPIPLMRGKKSLIVSLSTTISPWNRLGGQTSGTVKSIRKILRMAGIMTVTTFQRGGTRENPLDEKDFGRMRRKAAKLVRHLRD